MNTLKRLKFLGGTIAVLAGLGLTTCEAEPQPNPLTPFSVSSSNLLERATNGTTAMAMAVLASPFAANNITVLQKAQLGAIYRQALLTPAPLASGNSTSFTGTLPPGLRLTRRGILKGIPTQPGTYAFAVTVTKVQTGAVVASGSYSITVDAALTVSTTKLANATMGQQYAATLQATGGLPGYQWTVSSGQLPAGLTLSSNGTISGTPTASGASAFVVAVTDSSNPANTKTQSLSLTTAAPLLAITSKSVGGARKGAHYTAKLQATGGNGTFVWALGGGTLPQGLSLGTDGTISGTPASSGSSTFTVAVHDSETPAQQANQQLTLAVTGASLEITSSSLTPATSGTSYTATLSATGGTPGYTWAITSGSLPQGLTLNASTGTISGTPTSAGTSNFTYRATDSGNPQLTASATATLSIDAAPQQASGSKTWFVRPDGGTRYSAKVPTGQCNGSSDAAYPGSGVNQNCAYNDVRYMWMDGTYGNSGWVMAGGDTLVIRGCAALPSQQNADAPHCRIGWDKASGNDSENFWCAGVNSCSMPAPPSGSPNQHTRILGGCAYGDYSCNPVVGYPYTDNNLTQLFAGFQSGTAVILKGSKFVDLAGLEITTHNGVCARYGASHPLPGCNRGASYPLSDQADQGIVTNNESSDITLQDVYIHGFSSNGISGPIGGAFTLNRVSIDFNAFAGWNFDDGVPTKNALGSTLTQSYVTMVGNGCQEEYPITHPQFPAKGCWDSSTGGFGDAWSGQNSLLDTFTCDHCLIKYNTKDGALGPHTLVHNINITNSSWIGNMGQAGKWGQDANATFLFQNNTLIGNCLRMSQQLPGAAQNFDSRVNLPGSGLAGYCRAAGPLFDYFTDAGSTVNFDHNTVVTYQPTIFEPSCTTKNNCGATPYHFTNNVVLGFTSGYLIGPFDPGAAPALYYKDDGSVVIQASNNIEFGLRNQDTCGTNGILCEDPLLVNEPARNALAGTTPRESALDNIDFHLNSNSPAIGAGVLNSLSKTLEYYATQEILALTAGAYLP